MTAMAFLFRKPRLPTIIDTDTELIGAKSWVTCERQLANRRFRGPGAARRYRRDWGSVLPVSRTYGLLAPDVQKTVDEDVYH